MRRLILFFSSIAGLGYFPMAAGTIGTLAGIPCFYLLSRLPAGLYALSWLALLALACWAADGAGRIYGVVDDGRIVIDELVGYLTAVAFLPFSWGTALLGFLFFRIFDIVKCPPANWIDRHWKNGVGVVLDDVVAGLYAALALQLCLPLLQPYLETLP